MADVQHFQTSISDGDFFSRAGGKGFEIKVQKLVVENYLVREAVLQIFVGDKSEKIYLNDKDAVCGNCGGVYFEFAITPPPNYKKTINADFWTKKTN